MNSTSSRLCTPTRCLEPFLAQPRNTGMETPEKAECEAPAGRPCLPHGRPAWVASRTCPKTKSWCPAVQEKSWTAPERGRTQEHVSKRATGTGLVGGNQTGPLNS